MKLRTGSGSVVDPVGTAVQGHILSESLPRLPRHSCPLCALSASFFSLSFPSILHLFKIKYYNNFLRKHPTLALSLSPPPLLPGGLTHTDNSSTMPPRVTLHNQPSAHPTLKGKSPITAPVLAAEDVDIASDETDELAEDTVDSLDDPNSLQPQWETLSASASASASGNKLAKKPRQKPPAVRTPGQPLLSMTRIETIVNADRMCPLCQDSPPH